MRYVSIVLGAVSLAVSAATLAAPAAGPADQDTVTLRTLFNQLDRNGDEVLSRDELEANPAIADAYDSFDTGQTIQQPVENTRPGGVTYAQFAAGMQAAGKSGAFGPAVSGGQRYLEYPDGSREALPSP
ncbi:hypothetical protein [uncultured Salinisphaera sp.]|uniref:hypothetical protein n=1 Tax=uncultured Salinisphaera sp. TaxID=359372 RepID=UPI0032B11552